MPVVQMRNCARPKEWMQDLEELDKLLKDVIDIQSEMSTHESILREIQAKGLEGNKIVRDICFTG